MQTFTPQDIFAKIAKAKKSKDVVGPGVASSDVGPGGGQDDQKLPTKRGNDEVPLSEHIR